MKYVWLYVKRFKRSLRLYYKERNNFKCNPRYFTYTLLRGDIYREIVDIGRGRGDFGNVGAQIFEKFKQAIFSVGKGSTNRVTSHLLLAKRVMKFHRFTRDPKTLKIIDLWRKKRGVVIMYIKTDISHYEAASLEYVIAHS